MNLSTNYLGLKLANPLIVGASPFCDNTHVAHQLEDAGASAIVMRSLFEEQVDAEQRALAVARAAGRITRVASKERARMRLNSTCIISSRIRSARRRKLKPTCC